MSVEESDFLKPLESQLKSNSSILLAVSGGADSMALLYGCLALQEKLNLTIFVAHVDHGLRESSAEDLDFVKTHCHARNIPFFSKSLSSPVGENLEAWGRKERYSFFEEIRSTNDLDYIVTAHTKSDLAETFLIKLLANKELRTFSALCERRRLLRPLFQITRKEVVSFLSDSKIKFREDCTNRNQKFLRNRIRHSLIPVLQEEFERNIIEILAEQAESINEDLELIDSLVANHIVDLAEHDFGSKYWFRKLKDILRAASDAEAWRLVESVLLSQIGFKLGRKHSLRVCQWIFKKDLAIQLPGKICLKREKGGLARFIQE